MTAIIPALQIHLFESVSGDSLSRDLGRHYLNICMTLLGELRQTYWTADFIYSLFHKARRELDSFKVPENRTWGTTAHKTATSPANSLPPHQVARGDSHFVPQLPTTHCSELIGRSVNPNSNCPTTPKSKAATPTAEQTYGDHELDVHIPFDIDLALAYDSFGFQGDLLSRYGIEISAFPAATSHK